MTDDREYRIDPEIPEGAVPDEARPSLDPEPPMVVIEYRNRGALAILFPPLLLLLATLGILSYQRQRPIPRLGTLSSPPAPPRQPLPDSQDLSDVPKRSDPIVVRTERIVEREPLNGEQGSGAPPSKLVGAEPGEASLARGDPRAEAAPSTPPAPLDRAPSPFDLSPDGAEVAAPEPPPPTAPQKREEPPPLFGLVPPAVPAPDREPEPPRLTKEQVEEQIQREAAEKEAEIERLEELKPRLHAMEVLEVLRRTEANRVPFHDDLRRALRTLGHRAGPEIESLCDEYGRSTFPEIKYRVTRFLATTYGRHDIRSKIAMMRACGLPEPVILDYVARTVDRRVLGTRGGPRDQYGVWVHAARVLVGVPPRPARDLPMAVVHPQPVSNLSRSRPSPLVPGEAHRAQ